MAEIHRILYQMLEIRLIDLPHSLDIVPDILHTNCYRAPDQCQDHEKMVVGIAYRSSSLTQFKMAEIHRILYQMLESRLIDLSNSLHFG